MVQDVGMLYSPLVTFCAVITTFYQRTLLGASVNQKRHYLKSYNKCHYHIFCCNMFVFACPIIARSQCWLFAPPSGQIRNNYPYLPLNSTSGICAVISKKICQSTRKDGVYNHISIKLTRFKILE